jgi:hypothetical protein
LAAAVLGLVVGSAGASAADVTSTTFTSSGQQQTFVVPAGMTTVHRWRSVEAVARLAASSDHAEVPVDKYRPTSP